MERVIFCVNNEPYCLWDLNLLQRNNEFLKGLDPEYFSFLWSKIDDDAEENHRRLSVAHRFLLHHSTETLFSFLGAITQAPDCAYAWLAKCSTENLREFVKSVNEKKEGIFNRYNTKSVTWDFLAQVVFNFYKPGTDAQKRTIRNFGLLWSRLTNDYLSPYSSEEYNCFKHGFRISPGGFKLLIGENHENMQSVCESETGASFLKIEKIENAYKCNIRSRQVSSNWSFEKTVQLSQLVYISIHNTITGLKNINGVDPSKSNFLTPDDDEAFENPWKSTGNSSINMDYDIGLSNIQNFSKDDLMKIIEQKQQSKPAAQATN